MDTTNSSRSSVASSSSKSSKNSLTRQPRKSVTAHEVTLGKDISTHAKAFIATFLPFTYRTTWSREERRKQWSSIDYTISSGYANFSGFQRWLHHVLRTVHDGKNQGRGTTLWRLFKPCYLYAYNESKLCTNERPNNPNNQCRTMPGMSDSCISLNEFRVLISNICFAALAFDAFSMVGKGHGVRMYAGDEDLIDSINWNANHTSITNYGFSLLTRMTEPESVFADPENAFLDMADNDKINFGKWYRYLKMVEIIEGGQMNSKWAKILDTGKTGPSSSSAPVPRSVSTASMSSMESGMSTDSIKAEADLSGAAAAKRAKGKLKHLLLKPTTIESVPDSIPNGCPSCDISSETIAMLESQLADLRIQFKAKDAENETLKIEYDQALTRCLGIDDESDSDTASKQNADDEELAEQIRKTNDANHHLSKMADALKHENTRLMQQSTHYKTDNADMQRQLEKWENTMDTLTQSMEFASTAIDQHTAEMVEKDKKISSLKQDNQMMLTELVKNQQRTAGGFEGLTEELDELNNQLTELTEEYEDAIIQVDELMDEKQNLTMQFKEVTLKKDDYEWHIGELEDEIVHMKDQLEDAINSAEQLTESFALQLEQAEMEKEEREYEQTLSMSSADAAPITPPITPPANIQIHYVAEIPKGKTTLISGYF